MTETELIWAAILCSVIVVTTVAILVAVRRQRRARGPATVRDAAATRQPAAQPATQRRASVVQPVLMGPARPLPAAPGESVLLIRRGLPLVVPRREDPLWQEKGWQRNGRGYEGSYRAGTRRWRGWVDTPYPGSFDAYIWNPPLAGLAGRTTHRPCFSMAGADGRYKIHFHTMPQSLDHAIASIEAVLAQATGVR